MNKNIFLLILSLLLATFVMAEDFDISLTPIINEFDFYDADAAIIYNLTITNLKSSSDYFSVSLHDTDWLLFPASAIIEGGESETIELKFKRTGDVFPGHYDLSLNIRSRDEDVFVKKSVRATISIELDPKNYLPAVKVSINSPDKLDPRNSFSISINLKNKNALNIGDVELEVSGFVESSRKTTLTSLEEKTLVMTLNPDSLLLPGEYPLKVKVLRNGSLLTEFEKMTVIKSYSNIVQKKIIQKKFLGLVQIETLNLTNEGNVERTPEILRTTSLFSRFIMSSEQEFYLKEVDDKTVMSWELNILPQESKHIIIKKNYIPLTFSILFLVLLFVFYFKLRSPLIIKKEAKVLEASNEGISKIKLAIYVKNRSSKILSDVVLIDKIPSIATLIIDNSIGVVKPTRIKSAKSGASLLKWNLEMLDPLEERILTYKIKSKLNIIGGLKLPSVKARFMTHNDKEGVKRSNEPTTF